MFYWLEAAVDGGFGKGIDYRVDRTPCVLPPMRYEFSYWSGACIVNAENEWIVTRALADRCRTLQLTGIRFAGDVVVTRDPQWIQMDPDFAMPDEWEWIVPIGPPGASDFWVEEEFFLAVSSRALEVIEELGLGDGAIFPSDQYPGGPPQLDVQAILSEYERRRSGAEPQLDTHAMWEEQRRLRGLDAE